MVSKRALPIKRGLVKRMLLLQELETTGQPQALF